MDRTPQYVFGGLASGALIAAAIAAFITITSLVAGTDFPDGKAVPPPSGPRAVSVAPVGGPDSGAAPRPAGPQVLAPRVALSSPAAVHQLASVRRALTADGETH